MSRRGRRTAGERGVVLVLFTLALSTVMTMTALVFDLSQRRVDRRVNKTVADVAVRAALGVLHLSPWSGVCRAREFLKTNSRLSGLDDEKWFNVSDPGAPLASSPCTSTATAPFTTLCVPGQPSTWGRLTATAGSGRYSIVIQSGYLMPDARFPEDLISPSDTGAPLLGGCDNLMVTITEKRSPLFGGIVDGSDKTTTIRSVGRISNRGTSATSPALHLLERDACSVLATNGSNTRVIAQPYLDHPGVIQIDSADAGGCASNQAVLNGQATAAGPSIVACSAVAAPRTPSVGCNSATANKPGRIGIYALNLRPPKDFVTSPYPGSYGDQRAVPASQLGRIIIDRDYRKPAFDLDADARTVITGNSGKPPGCSTIDNSTSSCLGTDGTWLVLRQQDCNNYDIFMSTGNRAASRLIWFDCDLTVNSSRRLPNGLILSAANSIIVVTGFLTVSSPFAITDPRKIYIGGRSGAGPPGLDVGNGGNLNVGNPTTGQQCPAKSTYTSMVVADGSFGLGAGGIAHLCSTFMLMASGYGTIPTTDGTAPCNTCSGYQGTVAIGSGSTIDWTPPNLVTGGRPTPAQRLTSPFEDVALWTEAGGSNNQVSGGGSSALAGAYFFGNADPFTLNGGSGATVNRAQFIARRMVVGGGSVVNLAIDPLNSLPLPVYKLSLVR
ncbi:MAG: hypothetical protein WKF86_01805 [Acidimicrobiales bacterium]